MEALRTSSLHFTRCNKTYSFHDISKGPILWNRFSYVAAKTEISSFSTLNHGRRGYLQKYGTRVEVVSPNIAPSVFILEELNSRDDVYDGVIIDPHSLPFSSNAFASALRASLSTWKLKGKKGVWLKILQDQAELVPIAIQVLNQVTPAPTEEGFSYNYAEPGYVMLTYWIPNEPCSLPASPSHQIGIAGFVVNDKKQILVVKERCSCSCLGVWKLPTGYINKCEDIFSGAIREVQEETGVATKFLDIVAFRHAHLMASEKSDLMFVCMIKPLSYDIIIDDNEIQAAKWMVLEEVLDQPFYKEDHMLTRIIEASMATYEKKICSGFVAQHLTSKFDGNMACLYYNDNVIM